MTPDECHQQIRVVVERLIKSSLSVQQKLPSFRRLAGGAATIGANAHVSSLSLRDIPYAEIYKELATSESYHVKLVDGGLLIFQYEFAAGSQLAKHRLAYFPPPLLPTFDEAPALYERDEWYADVVEHRIVRFPVRFDFDPSAYQDVVHPKSHLTLGQYTNCRIPVTNPLRPKTFLVFVLRNFYHRAFRRNMNLFEKHIVGGAIDDCISVAERGIPHLVMA